MLLAHTYENGHITAVSCGQGLCVEKYGFSANHNMVLLQ